ncbi:YdcF family protein [Candidatus Peregrinibacteria bacterium]|nr:MAG: YdcF family protein [Candidatus Peregrinibacteria bacterium]
MTVFFLIALHPFASTAWVRLSTEDQIYQSTDEIPQKTAALVLGAAVYNARLSGVLQDRVDTGIELYERGLVDTLIMSGSANEAESMVGYAIRRGVDGDHLIQDDDGFNTLASIQNVPTSIDSVIIVTQAFHLPRALFYANDHSLDAIGVVADKQVYRFMNYYKSRELLSVSKAALDVFGLERWNEWVRNW